VVGIPQHPSAANSGGDSSARSLVFRVAGRVYACDAAAVREVVPRGSLTRLPGAPTVILGLANVRGTVVTVADAGAVLHGAPAQEGGSILLVDHGPRGVGLAVDRVADVRALRDDEGYQRLDVRGTVGRIVMIMEEQ